MCVLGDSVTRSGNSSGNNEIVVLQYFNSIHRPEVTVAASEDQTIDNALPELEIKVAGPVPIYKRLKSNGDNKYPVGTKVWVSRPRSKEPGPSKSQSTLLTVVVAIKNNHYILGWYHIDIIEYIFYVYNIVFV